MNFIFMLKKKRIVKPSYWIQYSLFLVLTSAFSLNTIASTSCQVPDAKISESSYTLISDVVYSSKVNSQPQKLDLYLRHSSTPRPLVVLVHGGGWQKGSKSSGGFVTVAKQLLRLGYSVASMDYPLTSYSGGSRDQNTKNRAGAAIKSLRCGLRFLRRRAARYNINPNIFVTMGTSAGGNLGSIIAYAPRKTRPFLDGSNCEHQNISLPVIKGNVGNAGVYDLSHYTAIDRPGATTYLGTDDPEIKIRRAKHTSPRYRVFSNDAPSFFIHQTGDPTVNSIQAQLISNRLDRYNVPYQTFILDGNGHVTPYFSPLPKYIDHSCALKRFLLKIKNS